MTFDDVLAQDEAGRVLVWRGGRDAPPERSRTPPAVPDPQRIQQDPPPTLPQAVEAERRRVDQVTEQHRELTALSLHSLG